MIKTKKKYNIKTKKKKYNFFLIILTSIILFFSIVIFLSIPVLFNYKSIESQIEKKFYSEFNINNSSLPLLGINPGASYGSAKRWYPQEFAKVATELSQKFDILIFL